MTKLDHEQQVKTVTQEISKYIDRHPNATEAAEGVARCWLLRLNVCEPF